MFLIKNLFVLILVLFLDSSIRAAESSQNPVSTVGIPKTLENSKPVDKSQVDQSVLATVGEYQVRQLVSPNFKTLPLNRKLFVYYLIQAMEAGHEIAWMQMSQGGIEVRQLLERIFQAKDAISQKAFDALNIYYFEILLHDGLYNVTSNQKFYVKNLTETDFIHLLKDLHIEVPNQEELVRLMFDPEFRKYRRATDGADKISGSGTQFYGPGITDRDIDSLSYEEAHHRLSFPIKDPETGKVSLRPIKIDGHYGKQLKNMDSFLTKAKQYAYPEEVKIITAYQKAMKTGDPQDLYNAEVEWVRYTPQEVGFNFYFVETYDDPKSRVGTFQGGVYLRDTSPKAIAAERNLKTHAIDFEQAMPVMDDFKNMGPQKLSGTSVAELIYWVGGSRAGGPTGFNLPNDQTIRTDVGTQSVAFSNKMRNLGEESEFLDDQLEAFFHPTYRSSLKASGRFSSLMTHVNFHEVLGHGSGRSLKGIDPEKIFGHLYESLEEGRAELAGLYHMLDSARLLEYGIWEGMSLYEAKETARMWAVQFFTSQIHSYVQLNGGIEIEQAHQLGRQIMLNWVLRKGHEVIEIEYSPDGVPWVKIPDANQLRKSLGELWHLIQDIKSLGLYHFYKNMVNENHHLTALQQSWVQPIKDANQRLHRPIYNLYLNPRPVLLTDDGNNIIDVEMQLEKPGNSLDMIIPHEAKRNQDREHSLRYHACTRIF